MLYEVITGTTRDSIDVPFTIGAGEANAASRGA